MTMTLRSVPTLALASCLLTLLACSATPESSGRGRGGDGGGTGAPVNPGTGGGGIQVIPMGSVDPSDTREVPIRKQSCDAANNCTCLRLALLGTLDSAANQKDTRPFIEWLNGNSGGSATVTMVSTKPTVDAAFLSQYDILLVANVNAWSFSAGEKAAVETWVRETGGGIVALTGFTSVQEEPAASSQLIQFAGLSFTPPETARNGESMPVYYKGGSTNLKNCLWWTGNAMPGITTPLKFQPQIGSLEKLTYGLDYVGAFIGWSVQAPASAAVVATDPTTGSNMVVAHEVDGTGRILAFGDEWVIFANLWEPQGNPGNMQQDQYNPCWQPAAGNAAGFFHSVQTLYQTKQFWYDAINWVAPPNECNFIVDDPDVIVIPR